MKKTLFIIMIVSLFVLVGYTMINDPIPMLTYKEVMVHDGKFQIKGTPVKEKFSYDAESQLFKFYLLDDNNDEFLVHYKGIKPGNYDQAKEVNVIGTLSKSDGAIVANRLLVKCPSKYQAEGGEGYEMVEY